MIKSTDPLVVHFIQYFQNQASSSKKQPVLKENAAPQRQETLKDRICFRLSFKHLKPLLSLLADAFKLKYVTNIWRHWSKKHTHHWMRYLPKSSHKTLNVLGR